MRFYCEKLYVARNLDWGNGLNRSLEGWRCTTHGGL